MKVLVGALLLGSLLITPAVAQQVNCDLPGNLLYGESPLNRVAAAAKATHHLGIAIIGTGSSAITGDGSAHAYPARLEAALTRRLAGVTVKVTAHTKFGQTAEQMLEDLEKVLADEKPALVVWQTGTVDAMRGVEPDAFGTALNDGVETIQSTGADVVLMNMQYSPRTETMIADSTYAENMRWVAQQRDVPLFDRLGIMRYWSDTGVFDFHAATKAFVTAQKVHECIGRALAAQIIDAARLGPMTSKVLQ